MPGIVLNSLQILMYLIYVRLQKAGTDIITILSKRQWDTERSNDLIKVTELNAQSRICAQISIPESGHHSAAIFPGA